MLYLPLSEPSVEYAAEISRRIYGLSRPTPRPEGEITAYWCGWVVHPETGEVALEMPENLPIPIHPDTDVTGIADVFGGPVTPEERAAIEAAAAALKGQQANPVDFIPPSKADDVRTREQMQAAGWFPEAAP